MQRIMQGALVLGLICLTGQVAPIRAAETGLVTVETRWGRDAFPGVEIEGRVYVALQGVSQLVSGAPTLEPALKLDGHRLYAMPLDDGAERSLKVALKMGEARPLELNPGFAAKLQAGVISSGVISWKGQMWVPVEDLAKATGAKLNIAFPDVCFLRVPSRCSSCVLVTASE